MELLIGILGASSIIAALVFTIPKVIAQMEEGCLLGFGKDIFVPVLRERVNLARIGSYTLMLLAAVGFGIMGYNGAKASFWWLDWQDSNALAILLAILFPALILHLLGKFGSLDSRNYYLERANHAQKEILILLKRSPKEDFYKLLDAELDKINKEINSEQIDPSNDCDDSYHNSVEYLRLKRDYLAELLDGIIR